MTEREKRERVAALCATRAVEVTREIETAREQFGTLLDSFAREIQFLLSEHARLNGCSMDAPSRYLH